MGLVEGTFVSVVNMHVLLLPSFSRLIYICFYKMKLFCKKLYSLVEQP